MTTRFDRVLNCIDSAGYLLLDKANNYCAPLDSQGLYFCVKLITNFLSIDPKILVLGILLIPFLMTLVNLAILCKITSGSFRYVSFSLFLLSIGIFDYWTGKIFQLLEWTIGFWITLFIFTEILKSVLGYRISIGKYIFLGLFLGLFDWIRSGASWSGLLLLLLIINDGKKYISLIAFILVLAVVKIYENQIIIHSNSQELHLNHVIWHSILIGFGWMQNPFGLEYADISGMNYINKIYGNEKLLIWSDTIKYELLAKKEVFNILNTNLLFVTKQLILKIIKSFAQIGIFVLPLIIIYRKFKISKAHLRLLPIFLVSIAPGILVIPSRPYLPSAIALSIIFVFLMHDEYYKVAKK